MSSDSVKLFGLSIDKFSEVVHTILLFTKTFTQQNEHCDCLILGHVPLIKFKRIPTGMPLRSCCLRIEYNSTRLFKGESKYIKKHLMYGPSGN